MPKEREASYFEEAAKRLAKASFVRVSQKFRTSKADTRWLGLLVLESARKYNLDHAAFGNKPKSVNLVMKKFLTQVCRNQTRRSNLTRLVEAYERGPRRAIAGRRIGELYAPEYLSRKGDVQFQNCVKDMIAKRTLAAAVAQLGEPSIDDRQCRHITARLTKVHCHEDSEWSSDEPYILTGASLSDPTGTWMRETGCSEYGGNVDPGDDVVFRPATINNLFDWRIENPSDNLSLWPVTALCTITLMEHDQGDKERTYQAFKAAYSATKLLIAIAQGTAGGPVGIALALISILFSLALALDGDDELGTLGIRFDDVLGGTSEKSIELKHVIDGHHIGKRYKYAFTVHYSHEDYSCPVEVPFGIRGPKNRTIPYMGGVIEGGYAIECPSPLHQIEWKVTPSQATRITQQGKRYTRIQWHHGGTYTVSVTAKEQSGIQTHAAEMSVTVRIDTGPVP